MKTFSDIDAASLDPSIRQKGSVISIGDFDGCHLGHQVLLKKVSDLAKENDCCGGALTFEPSPKVFFSHYEPNARLFRPQDKICAFSMEQLDFAILQNFTKDFASIDYKSFFHKILIDKLNAKHIVLGSNFKFGKNREGTTLLLEQLCEEKGIFLHSFDPEKRHGQRVSSTSIRKAIVDGNMSLATEYLGRPYFIGGRVVHGRKLGRTMGFPTANVLNDDQILPAKGVYAGLCILASHAREQARHFLDHPLVSCVINVGNRPTFTDGEAGIVIEAHLLEFDAPHELYDQELQLFFLDRLRNEQKFASKHELMGQIAKDCDAALEKIAAFFKNC